MAAEEVPSMQESKAETFRKLQEVVGKKTGPGDWVLVDQELINKFASIGGEDSWVHCDQERCVRETTYGGTIAQGNLGLSLIPLLSRDTAAYRTFKPYAKHSLNYGWEKVRYPAVLAVNSRVRAHSKLLEVRDVPGTNMLHLVTEFTVEVEGRDKPCCVAVSAGRFIF